MQSILNNLEISILPHRHEIFYFLHQAAAFVDCLNKYQTYQVILSLNLQEMDCKDLPKILHQQYLFMGQLLVSAVFQGYYH